MPFVPAMALLAAVGLETIPVRWAALAPQFSTSDPVQFLNEHYPLHGLN